MSFYPAIDDGVPTTAPFRRRVGHEVEISSSSLPDDPYAFARYLWDNGYGTPALNNGSYTRGLHGYHCRCDAANKFAVHTTYDGTAGGGEHIIGGTKGVLFGSPAYMEAIGIVAEAAAATGGRGENGTGGHIHVSTKGLGKVKTVHLFRNLSVLWGQILELASGSWDEVRSNGNMNPPSPGADLIGVHAPNPARESIPPQPPYPERFTDRIIFDRGGYSRRERNPNFEAQYVAWNQWQRNYGQYLTNRQIEQSPWECSPRNVTHIRSNSNAFRFAYNGRMPNTIEFRVWNTTVSRWRLYMGAGVSAALVEAAVQNRNLGQDSTTDLLDYLGGLLTADLVALVERQRAILRGDFSMAA